MLNPFPDLLVLGFFAPLILRVSVGLLFLWMSYEHVYKRREAIITSVQTNPPGPLLLKPYFGPFTSYIVWAIGAVELVVGAALVVGYFTQVASLLGIVLVLKKLYFKKHYSDIALLSVPTYLLLLAIFLSLLLSGAGALAFDLPL